ncbi:ATP-binding protein [Streptomyces carminius]|uniref:ATP-binding protein n=1 Tax=Streptomyces carminius TaxID=2665496 RepID=UPI001E584F18|nr:ATP-binding protein [Streptomyces carminius]
MASFPDVRPLEDRRGPVTGNLDGSLRDAFHLPAIGASVAEARRRVRARLTEWGIGAMVRDNAQLVVSELFTNAVRHTDSDKVDCELRFTGRRLRLEVTDRGAGPARPRARCAAGTVDAEGESGRGLLLVGALVEEWGVRPGIGRGHMVWAELRCARPVV